MGRLCFPRFSWLDYFKEFTFLIYIHYAVLGDIPERLPFPLTTTTQRKYSISKVPQKNPIKNMDISSLLNTDLGNLNDSNLIL